MNPRAETPEVHDDDISGIAVNLAARVEAQTADRELWTSSTLRDAMFGDNTAFTDRGEHEGIDGNRRLVSVTSAQDTLAPDRQPRATQRACPRTRVPERRAAGAPDRRFGDTAAWPRVAALRYESGFLPH